jgi:hypothetical protein
MNDLIRAMSERYVAYATLGNFKITRDSSVSDFQKIVSIPSSCCSLGPI